MEMLLLSEERECGKMKKKKSMFIILCMLTVLAAGTAHATEKERVDPLQPAIAEKILRFHVLANSDAKDDQNVKLKVRDAVGHMLGQKLKKVTDRAQTEKIVQDHMDEIIETAEKTLHKNGYTYGASARLANVDFPVKTYGIIRFLQANTVHCRLHWEKEKDITGGVCCIRICVFRDRYMRLWMNLPVRSCVKF